MKKRKFWALCLATCLLAGMVMACGEKSADTSSSAAEPAVKTAAETAEAGEEGTAQADAADSHNGEVHIAIPQIVESLDPFTVSAQGKNYIFTSLYQTLYTRSGFGGELEPALAKSYEQIDEYTYHITLYDYIYDTAGNHITADDVAWVYTYAKELGNVTRISYVDSCTAIDDYTVELVLNTTQAGGFETLISNSVYIVSKKAYEESADQMLTDPVGTTAYVVDDFVSGSSVTMKKADSFWQTDESLVPEVYRANADKLVFETITETSQASIALETGSVQTVADIDSKEVGRFMEGGASSDGFTVHETLGTLNYIMLFNCSDNSVFANQDLRQAVCYAIDTQALVDGGLEGRGTVMKTFGGSFFPDYGKNWGSEDYYDYDLDKAKELLEKAGYGQNELTVRLMIQNTSVYQNVAQLMQAYLAQAGINVEILEYDNALFQTYKLAESGEYDMLIDCRGSSDFITSTWCTVFDRRNYASGTTQNGVLDDELQSLLETASDVYGHTEESVDAFHQYLKEQAYGIGLFNINAYTVTVDSISEIVVDPKNYVVPGAFTYESNY